MACFDWVRWPMQIMGVLVTPIRNAANTPTDEPSRVSSPPRWGQTQKCEPKHAELRSTVRGGPIMAHCRYIWIAMFPDFVFVTKSRVNSSSIKKKVLFVCSVSDFCIRILFVYDYIGGGRVMGIAWLWSTPVTQLDGLSKTGGMHYQSLKMESS